MTRTVLMIVIAVTFAGCATAPPKDYTRFNAARPNSILIVPAVNNSVEVTASDYFLATISIPLAESGYYVFPINMVKRMLEDDGLSDSSLVHNASVEKLSNLFGADAVLYVTINQWDAQYLVLTTQVTVDLAYTIKDGRTGATLWEHQQKMVYAPSSSGGGGIGSIVAMAVTAAITKASPNYIPLARQANALTFTYPGPGIPPGRYHTPEQTK